MYKIVYMLPPPPPNKCIVLCDNLKCLFKIFTVLCCLVRAAPAHAQEEKWYEPFFIEASGQYYFTPGFFSEFIKPDIGFRIALGYEYRRFRFALESGYTHITGTNPLVLDLRFIPLTLKGGYALPLGRGWGLQADLNLGFVFSKTVHYETAIDMLMDKLKESSARSYLAGARLFGTYSFLRSAGGTYLLKAYAGGGIDAIFETGGVIPLPMIEIGISFKPLALIRPRASGRGQELPAQEEETPPAIEEETTVTEEPGRAGRLLNTVYFDADSAVIMERYRPILNEAGELLRSDPSLRIILRGYSAPFDTEAGQVTLSAARAWSCAEYLMQRYSISEERIGMEFYGADKMPDFTGGDWEFWRRVELIIEEGSRE